MKDWRKQAPPYEGTEPYLYLAFADADAGRIGELVRLLLKRGLRDAMTQDQDGKASILVNQKNGRKILCIDRDAADRALTMGLHESVPHLPAWQYPKTEDLEEALIRSDGFTQEMFGEPVLIRRSGLTGRLTAVLCASALLLVLGGFLGLRVFHWFQPEMPQDEIIFADETIRSRLDSLPSGWEDLEKLPKLTRIVLPQQAVLKAESLPDAGVVLVLTGGDAS